MIVNVAPRSAATATPIAYQTGFGNEHATEALPGALPAGQNSPQKHALGLYTELISGTAFTVPRVEQRRTWVYRMRPSADQAPFARLDQARVLTAPLDSEVPASRLRWDAFPLPDAARDFIDGLFTVAACGDAALQLGMAVHVYACNRSMQQRYFASSDGELMFVPERGELKLRTELGVLAVAPGEIAVVPRGIWFRVELLEMQARGYVCENYGAMFRLPELGPIGSNGLANPRDFLAPVAAYEGDAAGVQLVRKLMGALHVADGARSPFDVVGWHGNLTPYKYDLARFQVINTVSFDHCDPSIFTVLHSPSQTPGVANADFVIFPPRWLVAEHTFRPPWFHRNAMSEIMGLVHGVYDAKAEGFVPGGLSLHNATLPHGPDLATFERASNETLGPVKLDGTLAFMWESRYVFRPTQLALDAPQRQLDYERAWHGFPRNFKPSP